MLDDLGSSVSALLRDRLPAGTGIRLDPPSQSWAENASGIVGLFLHRVLETEVAGTAGIWTEDRDSSGRVVRRTSPERQYQFCYLVTAWGPDLDHELRLLGEILRAAANDPVVPPSRLTGSLTTARGPVTMAVGRPGPPFAPAEIWAGLGLRPRSFLDLVVTAPVAPVAQTELRRTPEVLDLAVADPFGPTAIGKGRSSGGTERRPAARITEGAPDEPASGETG